VFQFLREGSIFESNEKWNAHESEMKNISEQMMNLGEKMKFLAGQCQCRDDNQCRVVGLGKKTCGGYQNFLVYSTIDGDENGLLSLVSQYEELDQKYLDLSMKVLPCGELSLEAHCIDERCTVGNE
jgi:hypothetical protein